MRTVTHATLEKDIYERQKNCFDEKESRCRKEDRCEKESSREEKVASKKKVVSRKAITRKTTAPVNVKAIAARQTKTQIIAAIAEECGLDKKQVASVFSALGRKLEAHVKPRGSGEFTIPETGIKVSRVIKPRTKARMGRNPATGEAIKIAAKPARKAIRLTALKWLKLKI